MKTLGKISLGIVLVGLGLVIAGFIAGGGTAFRPAAADDYVLVDETYAVAAITDIALDFANKRVTVLPAEDGDIRIVYYVTEDIPVTVTETATTLTFEEESVWRHNWFDFSWLFGALDPVYFGCTLYLPTGVAFAVDIVTANGTVNVSDLVDLASLSVYTSNGAIDMTDVHAVGTIDIVSTNGTIELADIVTLAGLNVRTSNGRIEADDVVAADVVLKTSNGPVEVTRMTADELEVDTSNGNVDVSLYGDADDFRILLETSNGSMYVDGVKMASGSINPSLPDVIDLDTSNGTIRLNFLS